MKLSHRCLAIVSLVAALLGTASGRATAGDQITLPPIHPATEVSLSAQVSTAYAAAVITGSFRIQRTGEVLQGLTIAYQVSGKAVAGHDYVALKGTRTIPAGKNVATITIHPLVVSGGGGTVKGVRVTLLPGDGYSLDTAMKATVKIVQ